MYEISSINKNRSAAEKISCIQIDLNNSLTSIHLLVLGELVNVKIFFHAAWVLCFSFILLATLLHFKQTIILWVEPTFGAVASQCQESKLDNR